MNIIIVFVLTEICECISNISRLVVRMLVIRQTGYLKKKKTINYGN